jgi:ribosomal protein S18 acetylase RimI-like enzyme
MTLSAKELKAIEAAAVRGWPALATHPVHGWLARWSSGGSVRANSVATVAFDADASLETALSEVAAFYRTRNSVPRINVTGTSEPGGLDAALAARGWQREGDHVTMAKRVGAQAPATATVRDGIERHRDPTEEWFGVYLQGLTPDRRGVAARLVAGVPRPRCFYSCRRDGLVVASGLTVIDGELASVQCMATLPAARRTGAATAVLEALEADAVAAGVRLIYLQTDAANAAAIGLYEKRGFLIADRYHSRVLRPATGPAT